MISLLALALVVRVQASHCTTEPAPAPAELKVLSHKGATLRVRVIGEGHFCAAGWTATVDHGKVILHADDSVDAPACPGSCAITLRITHVPRGKLSVVLG